MYRVCKCIVPGSLDRRLLAIEFATPERQKHDQRSPRWPYRRRPSRCVLCHKLPLLRVELRLRHSTQLLSVRANQIRCQITIAQCVIKPELQTAVRSPHRKLANARVQGRVVLEHWTSDVCIVCCICAGRRQQNASPTPCSFAVPESENLVSSVQPRLASLFRRTRKAAR